MTYCRDLCLFLVAGMQILRAPMGTSAADNPCPDVFQYEGRSSSEYGIITVPNPYPYLAINISVETYITAPVPSPGTTKLEAVDSDVWRKLAAGSMDPVLYRLDFPVSSPLPTIKSITVNGDVICNGTVPDAEHLTTATVQHAIFNDRCESASLECPFNIQLSSGRKQQESPPLPQRLQNGSSINIECGTILVNIPLIAGGEDTVPGQWPWHAAVYLKINRQIRLCGGSFVGTRTVITAAHCVTKEGEQLRAEDITVYLGRHNLLEMNEQGLQFHKVSNILVHPSYNTTTYVGNLAVLILSTTVEVTTFVRPVCLWGQDNSNPADIINETGLVVGWGLNERDVPTDKLMMVKMPVVSQQTCIRSDPNYYSHFTSNGTFCAGFRNGSSVCPGDSGGGMVFSRQLNDGTDVLMLRGIVSHGRIRGSRCDTKSYVIFTDVAEYLDWIYEILM